jgi:hypothetical protein
VDDLDGMKDALDDDTWLRTFDSYRRLFFPFLFWILIRATGYRRACRRRQLQDSRSNDLVEITESQFNQI